MATDTERMDFLERQNVTIQNSDLLIVNPARLRAAVDEALEQEESCECSIHGRIQGASYCPRC